MKFIVDWIEDILGLFGNTEVYSELPKENEKQDPNKKEKVAPAFPKLTKASLAKLTKAGIAEEGEKLGITISSKLKKEEMINQVLKHK